MWAEFLGDIEAEIVVRDRHEHVDLRIDRLLAELELVDWLRVRTQFLKLFPSAEEQALTRADGRAHRLESLGCAVVTHIALHHQLDTRDFDFRYAERTRESTVIAADATFLFSRLNNAVRCFLDRICRTNFGARRTITVHANHGSCLRRVRSIDVLKVNHRRAFVRIAFRARLHAGFTADAAIGIDEEFELGRNRHDDGSVREQLADGR